MLQLVLEPPAWDLPTSNVRCLETLLYLKTGQVPFEARTSAYPYHAVTGELPSLQYGYETHAAADCVRVLKEHFCDLDQGLSREEEAGALAFRKLVYEQLDQALLALFWSDATDDALSFTGGIRPAYASHAPFPVSTLLRYRRRQQVRDNNKARGIPSTSAALAMCREVLQALHTRLGGARYFSGSNRACSLDVCVAARMAVLYHVPATRTNPLKEMLVTDFPSLIPHFQRILGAHFPEYNVTCELKDGELEAVKEHLAPTIKTRPAPMIRSKDDLANAPVEEKKMSKEEKDQRRKVFNYLSTLGAVGVCVGAATFYRARARAIG